MYNFNKTLEAVGILLKQVYDRTDDYLRILHLLYISEKEMLLKKGSTMTGNRFICSKKGLIMREAYLLVKGQHFAKDSLTWKKYI